METSADIDQLCISTVSAEGKTHWIRFISYWFFSQLCQVFSGPLSFYVLCRQLKVLLSPRSPWCLSSRDFTLCLYVCVCVKPDGLVCLERCLVAALPLFLPCAIQMSQR